MGCVMKLTLEHCNTERNTLFWWLCITLLSMSNYIAIITSTWQFSCCLVFFPEHRRWFMNPKRISQQLFWWWIGAEVDLKAALRFNDVIIWTYQTVITLVLYYIHITGDYLWDVTVLSKYQQWKILWYLISSPHPGAPRCFGGDLISR